MRLLNVGGGSKTIPIPPFYAEWEHVLLDVDTRGKPDIVADARKLDCIADASFDAVYCSHNLEHYHRHEVESVLCGFRRVVKPDGFAHIRVPNIDCVVRKFVEQNADIDDTLYTVDAGAISFHDVLMGWGKEIAATGNEFYSHKTAFTPQLLGRVLQQAGFAKIVIYVKDSSFEIESFAFLTQQAQERYAFQRSGGHA